MFEVKYTERFNREYEKLYGSNPEKCSKVDKLRDDVLEHPRSGTERSERLKHKTKEVWSRHIDRKNRLVYSILDGNTIRFEHCLGHYDDH
jgi:toxin YoeB